jgi:hypothetical protein
VIAFLGMASLFFFENHLNKVILLISIGYYINFGLGFKEGILEDKGYQIQI